jgi:hypothetical protein
MIFFSNLVQATSHFVSRGVWLERGPSARRLHQRARLLLPQRLRQLPGIRCTLEARRVLNQLSIFLLACYFLGVFLRAQAMAPEIEATADVLVPSDHLVIARLNGNGA